MCVFIVDRECLFVVYRYQVIGDDKICGLCL